MAASKQMFKHTHACAQCSNASVGLTQACPNRTRHALYLSVMGVLLARSAVACSIHVAMILYVGTLNM